MYYDRLIGHASVSFSSLVQTGDVSKMASRLEKSEITKHYLINHQMEFEGWPRKPSIIGRGRKTRKTSTQFQDKPPDTKHSYAHPAPSYQLSAPSPSQHIPTVQCILLPQFTICTNSSILFIHKINPPVIINIIVLKLIFVEYQQDELQFYSFTGTTAQLLPNYWISILSLESNKKPELALCQSAMVQTCDMPIMWTPRAWQYNCWVLKHKNQDLIESGASSIIPHQVKISGAILYLLSS